jgi:uncharacterized membrane protein YciS (DUF1049 family)
MIHFKRLFLFLLIAAVVLPAVLLIVQNNQIIDFDTIVFPPLSMRVGTLVVSAFIGGAVIGFLVALYLLLAARIELNDLRIRLKKTNTELHQLRLGASKP